MPKRAHRASTTPTRQAADGADRAAAADGAGMGASDRDRGVEERGAFAVARCDRCGWQGSARRSRDRARKDLKQHLEDKPKHADHVSLEDVPR